MVPTWEHVVVLMKVGVRRPRPVPEVLRPVHTPAVQQASVTRMVCLEDRA